MVYLQEDLQWVSKQTANLWKALWDMMWHLVCSLMCQIRVKGMHHATSAPAVDLLDMSTTPPGAKYSPQSKINLKTTKKRHSEYLQYLYTAATVKPPLRTSWGPGRKALQLWRQVTISWHSQISVVCPPSRLGFLWCQVRFLTMTCIINIWKWTQRFNIIIL